MGSTERTTEKGDLVDKKNIYIADGKTLINISGLSQGEQHLLKVAFEKTIEELIKTIQNMHPTTANLRFSTQATNIVRILEYAIKDKQANKQSFYTHMFENKE